jgi:hypothetical protein
MRRVSVSVLALGILVIAVVTGWFIGWIHGSSVSSVAVEEPICPGGSNPDPNVIVCEDFETGTGLTTWSSSPWCCDTDGNGFVRPSERDFVICGSQGFRSNCAAWTDAYKFGQHYAQRSIVRTGFEEIHARWYAYLSDPFRWDPTGDKNFMLRDSAGGTFNPYVLTSLWGTGKPHIIVYNNSATPCVSQSTPSPNGEYMACVNRTQNMGNDLVLQPGRWYLFEWYVKLDTPGMADGVIKLWVDDATVPISGQTLRASYTDVVFRTAADGRRRLTDVMLTAYANARATNAIPTQYTKWDGIVISRAPIGPRVAATP